MTQHYYVDIAPHVRQQALRLSRQANDIARTLQNFMAAPEMVRTAKRSLKTLRAEALALSREI